VNQIRKTGKMYPPYFTVNPRVDADIQQFAVRLDHSASNRHCHLRKFIQQY